MLVIPDRLEPPIAGDDAAPVPFAKAVWILAVLTVATFIAVLDRAILALFVDPIRDEFQVSDTQIGLLYGAAFSVCFAMASLPLGWLADRASRRNILCIGTLVWSAMTVWSGLATSFSQLFLARVGVGIGEACLIPTTFSMLSDVFRRDQFGRATGVLGAATTIGSASSLLIGGVILWHMQGASHMVLPYLGEMTTWRGVYIIIGLPGLLVALLLLTFREPVRRQRSTARQPGSGDHAYLPFLKANARLIASIIGANFLLIVAATAMAAWSATTLIRKFGIAPSDVGMMLGVALIISGLSGPTIGGMITDRWARRGVFAPRMRLYYPSVALILAGQSVFAVAPWPLLAILGLLVSVMGTGALAVTSLAALQEACPAQFRGRTLAISMILTNGIASALGPWAVAFVNTGLALHPTMLAFAIIGVSFPSLCLALGVVRFALSSKVERSDGL
ncbi:MAG: MFS transporter [Sphingobium sp.]